MDQLQSFVADRRQDLDYLGLVRLLHALLMHMAPSFEAWVRLSEPTHLGIAGDEEIPIYGDAACTRRVHTEHDRDLNSSSPPAESPKSAGTEEGQKDSAGHPGVHPGGLPDYHSAGDRPWSPSR